MSPAYLAVCAAGAVVLSIEAVQQFRKPGSETGLNRFSILRDVQIDALCTRTERARGAVFYVGIYLVIYALLIGSDQVYQVFMHAAGDQAGPTGAAFLSDKSLTVDGFDMGRPFFIATAIMVAMVTGILAPVERAFRSISHRAANIPNGVFRIVDELQNLDLEPAKAAPEQGGGKLLCLFDKKFAAKDGLDQSDSRNDARKMISLIDQLHPVVIGDDRSRLFGNAITSSLDGLREKLDDAHKKLIRDLKETSEAGAVDQDQIYQQTEDLRDNIMAVFAIQFIRNGRSFATSPRKVAPAGHKALMHLQQKLRRAEEANMDSLIGAFLYCAFGSLLCIALIYIVYIGLLSPFLTERTPFSSEVVQAIVGQSTGFALSFSMMCLVSGWLVLLVREIYIDQGKWGKSRIDQPQPAGESRDGPPPLSRLVLVVLLTGLVGALAFAFAVLVQEFVQSRILTGGQVINLLTDRIVYFLFFWPISASIAFGVLLATDWHDRLSADLTIRKTLMVLVPVGLLSLTCVLVAVPNRTMAADAALPLRMAWTLRETLFLLIPIAIFLTRYAWLLERSEKQPDDKTPKKPKDTTTKQVNVLSVLDDKTPTKPKDTTAEGSRA